MHHWKPSNTDDTKLTALNNQFILFYFDLCPMTWVFPYRLNTVFQSYTHTPWLRVEGYKILQYLGTSYIVLTYVRSTLIISVGHEDFCF